MSPSSSELLNEAVSFVIDFNTEYDRKHEAFERQFWGTKMALKSPTENGGDNVLQLPYTAENLSRTKTEMEDLLADSKRLQQAQTLRNKLGELPEAEQGDAKTYGILLKVLDVIIRTGKCYDMSHAPPKAKELRQQTAKMESELEMARNSMKLGYHTTEVADDNKKRQVFHELSSVGLRNIMRTSENEAVRKAAYEEGLRSIGKFVLENGFVDIIKYRNQMAKSLGFLDYYDYKVTNAEGFGKIRLFEILDELEKGTRPIQEAARVELEKRHGKSALEPYNMSFALAGSIVPKLDPYFPFSKAAERYVRSYAAMGITYAGSTMNLDLLDRPKKYSNGFCHWPRAAYMKLNKCSNGDEKKEAGLLDEEWSPALTNFTSLADPKAVGSGFRALTTLMHEAGHAAHFANIRQYSPLFSQERAPTSVAYAENQSMFLDSLVGDVDWRVKYARKKSEGTDGELNDIIPFEIIEEETRSTHPFEVFQLRRMLAVSYFEKALYELPEAEVSVEKVLSLADEIEKDIMCGGLDARPLLSVPHIIADEASCYYHGYTLAEMSVHQTREFFMERDGYITDNPKVGPTLTKSYWECGNSRPFLELVKELTGKELSGAAWIAKLKEPVEEKVARQRKEYEAAVAKLKDASESDTNVDLDMTVKFVDGDEVIADSSRLPGGILEACKKFEDYVEARASST